MLIFLSCTKISYTKKIQSHLDIFKLEMIYNEHKDYAIELYVKSKLEYSIKFRDYLKSFEGFSFSENELDQFIIGNYSEVENIHKRPLAKFQQDIARQLGLIK